MIHDPAGGSPPCERPVRNAPRASGPPPSTRRIVPSSAPHTRAAFSATASSTGCSAVCDRLMTSRISRRRPLLLERLGQLAIRCASSVLRQAGVLDGDGGLGGEALEQGDLLAGERPRPRPADDDAAEGHAIAQQRHDEDCADPVVVQAQLNQPAEPGADGGAQVAHVDRPARENRVAERRVSPDRVRVAEPLEVGKSLPCLATRRW